MDDLRLLLSHAVYTTLTSGRHTHNLSEIARRLRSTATYVAGGFVRNAALQRLLHHDPPVSTSDIDLLVEGVPARDELFERLSDFNPTTSRLGGAKFRIESTRFDVWRVEDQIGLKTAPSQVVSVQDALRCFTYTVDAVAFDVESGEIAEHLFFDAFTSRLIELSPYAAWEARYLPSHLAQLAYLLVVTPFQPTPNLLQRARSVLSPSIMFDVRQQLEQKKPAIVTACLGALCKALALPMHLSPSSTVKNLSV